jgi:esterase/lipase superfamily enzyme
MLFFNLILTSVLIASDSQDVGNMDQIAKKTQFYWAEQDSSLSLTEQDLRNKNVLVVVHGYNNTFPDAITSVDDVNSYLGEIQRKDHKTFYDLIIGYIWPAYDSFVEYGFAVNHSDELKVRVFNHLKQLKNLGANIDVLAHSLGNRLILEALSKQTYQEPLIDHFFSMAPAVDVNSIEKGQIFHHDCHTIKSFYVMHSSHDDVLKYVYPLASFHEALGSDTLPNLKKIPSNIQFVDCSSEVAGHGYYFPCFSVYKFMEKVLTGQNASPQIAKKVKLHKDGVTTKIR